MSSISSFHDSSALTFSKAEKVVFQSDKSPSSRESEIFSVVLEDIKRVAEYTNLSNLILDKKFEKGVRLYEKNLNRPFSAKLFEKILLRCAEKDGLTFSNLKEKLDEASAFLSEKTGISYEIFRSEGFVSYKSCTRTGSESSQAENAHLLTLSESLAEILGSLSAEEMKNETVQSQALRISFASLFLIKECFQGHSLFSSLLVSGLFMMPLFEKQRHLLGLTASMVAYTMNCGVDKAVLIGVLSSAIMRRNSDIPPLFKKVVARAEPVADAALKKISKGISIALQKTVGIVSRYSDLNLILHTPSPDS